MATESLSSVVIDVLKNNHKVGKSVIDAYRVGGARLASQLESRWEWVLDTRAGKFNKGLHSRLTNGGQKVSHFLSQRIEKLSNTADKALEKAYDGAATVVKKVTAKVDAVDNEYATRYFDYVGKVTLPSAKLARGLTEKLADGVETAYDRLAPKRKTAYKSAKKAISKRVTRAKTSAA